MISLYWVCIFAGCYFSLLLSLSGHVCFFEELFLFFFSFYVKKVKFSPEFTVKNYFLDFFQERIFIWNIIPLNLIK